MGARKFLGIPKETTAGKTATMHKHSIEMYLGEGGERAWHSQAISKSGLQVDNVCHLVTTQKYVIGCVPKKECPLV